MPKVMSLTVKRYQLTQNKISVLFGKGYTKVECSKCNDPILLGETCCSKQSGIRKKFYHEKCAEMYNLL